MERNHTFRHIGRRLHVRDNGNAAGETRNGNGGNDLIVGDILSFRVDTATHSTFGSAFVLTASTFSWNAYDSDLVGTGTTPHTPLRYRHGNYEWYAVTLDAGATVTIDIDFANFDSWVHFYDTDAQRFWIMMMIP